MAELLLIPGPVTVSADVLAAAAQPMRNHRGPFAAKIYADLVQRLQDIFQTKQPVLLLGSSGTGAMEASVVNLFSPGDKLVAMPMGAFGDRHVALARAYGAEVEILGCDWGIAPDPQRLRDRLAADRTGTIKGVLVTHNETSTGVQADLEALARARADHPALLVVDAVSSVGATNVKMDDWGLDAVITASQKAIAGVAGAAMIALSKRAWEASERASMPRFYFDTRKAQTALAKGQTPWTPPFGVLLALEQATDNYMKEGRHSAFARHARFAAAIRAGCSALGLSLFARPGVYSNTVTAISATRGHRSSGAAAIAARALWGGRRRGADAIGRQGPPHRQHGRDRAQGHHHRARGARDGAARQRSRAVARCGCRRGERRVRRVRGGSASRRSRIG